MTDTSPCGNYRGISLLSLVRKVFAETSALGGEDLSSGYGVGRSTADCILTFLQLIENIKKQLRNLYTAFGGITRASPYHLEQASEKVIIRNTTMHVRLTVTVSGDRTKPFGSN